jgi:zinc/manganese transport system ATP-binding protein
MIQPIREQSVVELKDATLRLGDRVIWDKLNLEVKPGEFLAILGPNGAGKTTLLKVLLGLLELSSGTALVCGEQPRRGNNLIGYIPQQKGFDSDLPIRGRDLVALGIDGHKYGIPFPSAENKELVTKILKEVGATSFADSPIGKLSGGEQQRLRVAQALLGDPKVILCDEPLLSLDMANQQKVTALIDSKRKKSKSAVLFVTHEINPILSVVDRVLYLVGGKWAIGTPDEVMTSKKLSELYGTEVDVLLVRDRIIVVGSNDPALGEDGGHHHH